MKLEIRGWIILVIALVIAGSTTFFIIDYVKTKRDVKRAHLAIDAYSNAVKRYDIVVDSLQEQVIESEIMVYAKDKVLRLSQAQEERLRKENIRKVNAITHLELSIAAVQSRLPIKHDTIIKYVEKVDNRNMIDIPASFGYQDEWVEQWAIIDESGTGEVGFNMESIPLDITLGSRGVFKKDYISAISSPNPYVVFDASQTQLVVPKKTKPIVLVGTIGLITGTVATLLLVK